MADDGHLVAYADQETRRLDAEARDFMQVVAIALDGVPVEFSVRFGDPAREILDETDLFGADLIVLGVGRRRHFLGAAGASPNRCSAALRCRLRCCAPAHHERAAH